MKTVNISNLTFDRLIELVRQLSVQEKIILSKELEKEGINSKLSSLLKTFKTNELSEDTINEEAEYVRDQIYERKKY
jgi:hypothetical protein